MFWRTNVWYFSRSNDRILNLGGASSGIKGCLTAVHPYSPCRVSPIWYWPSFSLCHLLLGSTRYRKLGSTWCLICDVRQKVFQVSFPRQKFPYYWPCKTCFWRCNTHGQWFRSGVFVCTLREPHNTLWCTCSLHWKRLSGGQGLETFNLVLYLASIKINDFLAFFSGLHRSFF